MPRLTRLRVCKEYRLRARAGAQVLPDAIRSLSLAREIIQEVDAGMKTRLDQSETRAEKRMQMHFENMEGAIRLGAEGYGATLEGIDRRLEELNKNFDTKFGDHDIVLADHNKRIATLEERS